MTIDKIKEIVKKNKGIEHSFRFRGTRNQIDEFDGVITDVYQAIFVISITDETSKIKTFSYSDMLMENLKIID